MSPQGPNTNDPFFVVEATKQGSGVEGQAGGAGGAEEWPRRGGSSGFHRMAGRLA